ncbi:MAG: hypothetical protein SXU28_01950 [Pseudomonadota bacterium]|nr:hypothetical protein [Pseudomonadota bacterium]
MLNARNSIRTASGLALVSTALSMAAPAVAQDSMVKLPELPPVGGTIARPGVTTTTTTTTDVSTLPAEYRRLPVGEELSETTIGADGVETITRTRRIAARAPATPVATQMPATQHYAHQGYYPVSYAPAAAPAVFSREQWLDECRRRTDGRSEREKGGIIGGLLGAIAGGIIGNRVADGERLAGTLIGAGTGGLAGLVLGNIIGGGKKNDRYDCEAALNGYMNQYGTQPVRVASRSIPAPVAYPAYTYAQPTYAYAPAYTYAQPQQVVLVPVQTQQQQRVLVRETVREEVIPGATRSIPRAPSPKMIKQAPAPLPVARPAPRPTKYIKN